jgi:hypothetical protein
LDHPAPPLAFDVLFKLNSERAIIPRRTGTTINFARLKDKASPLGERHDVIELA